jgi:hypothetical protein
MAAFERAYPGRVVGIGQDPPEALEDFTRELGMGIGSLPDLPPYDVSNAYGILSVPTLFLVDAGGTVLESVGAWDREGFNRVSRRLAELVGAEPAVVSDASDGLPAFGPAEVRATR